MKISLAQINHHIGNFEGNLQKMLDAVTIARNEGSDIVCFGELATCGYPPRDFLEFDDFVQLAYKSVDRLLEETDDIAIVLGSPTKNPEPEGKNLHNSVLFYTKEKFNSSSTKPCCRPTMYTMKTATSSRRENGGWWSLKVKK